jgi:hypothetical protein
MKMKSQKPKTRQLAPSPMMPGATARISKKPELALLRLLPILALVTGTDDADPRVIVATHHVLGESGFEIQPCYAQLTVSLRIEGAANQSAALQDFRFGLRAVGCGESGHGRQQRSPADIACLFLPVVPNDALVASVMVAAHVTSVNGREESLLAWEVFASYRSGPYVRVPDQPLLVTSHLPCKFESDENDPTLAVSPALSVAYGAGLVRVFDDSLATFHVQLNDQRGNAVNMSAPEGAAATLDVSISIAMNTVVRTESGSSNTVSLRLLSVD